jgi:hypothetical protein
MMRPAWGGGKVAATAEARAAGEDVAAKLNVDKPLSASMAVGDEVAVTEVLPRLPRG